MKDVNRCAVGAHVMARGCGQFAGETEPIIVTHVHDEADMQVKSYLFDLGMPLQLQNFKQGRSSKVQNHVIKVHLGPVSLPFYTELQALHKKHVPDRNHASIQ